MRATVVYMTPLDNAWLFLAAEGSPSLLCEADAAKVVRFGWPGYPGTW